jgi:hypothetical protein
LYNSEMAPRGRLAQLERQLAALDARRRKIIHDIHAAAAGLTAGVSQFVAAERTELAPLRKAVKRRFSKEARAKLAAAAKKRWAEAKKAGKKRLG